MTRSVTSACPSDRGRSTSGYAKASATEALARKLTPARALAALIISAPLLMCLAVCSACTGEQPRDAAPSAQAASHEAPQPNTASAEPSRPSLERGRIARALDALLAPLPKPLRILTITALPSLVVAQVQNTQNPSEVHQYQYTYADSRIDGPQKVKLMGKGSLKDNLFRPPSAEPRMAEEALTNVTNQYKHPARKLVMIRNLPESMDIQFRVTLETPSGELVVVTDKHGRVLGPLAANASNTNPSGSGPSGINPPGTSPSPQQ